MRRIAIANRTPYPDAEVRRLVEKGMFASPGAVPAHVIVRMRGKRDDEMGWTPVSTKEPTIIWLEPADRYPQNHQFVNGARSWQDELLTTALHESHHYRHRLCAGKACEDTAEEYAQKWRRKLRAYR